MKTLKSIAKSQIDRDIIMGHVMKIGVAIIAGLLLVASIVSLI